jgi:hypothetical protein
MAHVISTRVRVAIQFEEKRIEFGSRNVELQPSALLP